VKCANFLAIAGIETARPNVASDRYAPCRRSAGRPNRKPTAPATSPASGIVASSFQPWCATRIAVVYAPIAMKAPWPSEIWPL